MPAALKTKEEVLSELAGVFRRYGYDGASLAILSETTGLAKASLYHYFPNGKQDMALSVLEHLGAIAKRDIFDVIDYGADIQKTLPLFCKNVARFYNEGGSACILEVFTLGQARDLFRELIAARIERWQETFSKMLQSAGYEKKHAKQRALDAIIIIEGALVVARAADNPKIFMDAMDNLPGKLLVS